MRKRLTLQASGNSYFQGYECEHCGSQQVLACDSNQPYCAYCGEELGSGVPVSRAEITASSEYETIHVKCVACNSVFAVDGTEDTGAEIAASKYCPNCAGDALVPCNASGEPTGDQPVVQQEQPAPDTNNQEQKVMDENIVQDDQQQKPESAEALNPDDLQWSAVDTAKGEMTAMVAASKITGNPLAIFRKENAPASMQPLFAQSLFISAFNEVAEKDGMAEAIKAFGGNYFTPKVFTAQDIEKAALNKLQATAIPRLVDCCQMAVEGGVKGIYPDVYTSLQRSIVNELVASGVDSERATKAVASTFSIHGSELFGTIMSKAMELYIKPENIRAEAKAMIMQASVATPSGLREQAEVKAALEKPTMDFGILNITASANQSKDEMKNLRHQLF